MFYTGPSMNPTLRTGDKLYVIPYEGEKIRRGDVIAFIPPEGESKVVHRVASVNSQGIRTRGDNNNQGDPWVLSPDQVVGQVVFAKRRNAWRRVFGGLIGELFTQTIRVIRVVDSCASFLLRPAYNRLARTGIFKRWLPAHIKTRVISYTRPTGIELQLLMGRRVIGRRLPGKTQWHIQRPFRLFVSEASLSDLSVVNQDNEVM